MASEMNEEFFRAFCESDYGWLTWCGQWMLYDGALFVTREGF